MLQHRQALKDMDKFLTSSTQVLKAFDECDFFASGIEARGVVWPKGQPGFHPLNPRYLGKAMQDHQALKTIRTEIKNFLRTKLFKDQEPTFQYSKNSLCTRRELSRFDAGFCGCKGAEAQADRCS